MKTRILYEFIGASCEHTHPFPKAAQQGNPFRNGWERPTIAFVARDWFSGPVNPWLKDRLSQLGIPWLEFVPKSKPTPFAHMLAAEMQTQLAEVSDEEAEQSSRQWAALQQGASIFEDVCVVPSCVNYDEMSHLLPQRVDVTVHTPTELLDQILSDLYDWNHEGGE